MYKLVAVALGGAVGALSRFGLCGVVNSLPCVKGLPVGTLLVNMVGAFLIGFVAGGAPLKPVYREMLVIGVLGGFTTFAAFSWDMLSLAKTSNGTALVGLVVSVLLPLLATWGGLRLSAVWFPAWH